MPSFPRSAWERPCGRSASGLRPATGPRPAPQSGDDPRSHAERGNEERDNPRPCGRGSPESMRLCPSPSSPRSPRSAPRSLSPGVRARPSGSCRRWERCTRGTRRSCGRPAQVPGSSSSRSSLTRRSSGRPKTTPSTRGRPTPTGSFVRTRARTWSSPRRPRRCTPTGRSRSWTWPNSATCCAGRRGRGTSAGCVRSCSSCSTSWRRTWRTSVLKITSKRGSSRAWLKT